MAEQINTFDDDSIARIAATVNRLAAQYRNLHDLILAVRRETEGHAIRTGRTKPRPGGAYPTEGCIFPVQFQDWDWTESTAGICERDATEWPEKFVIAQTYDHSYVLEDTEVILVKIPGTRGRRWYLIPLETRYKARLLACLNPGSSAPAQLQTWDCDDQEWQDTTLPPITVHDEHWWNFVELGEVIDVRAVWCKDGPRWIPIGSHGLTRRVQILQDIQPLTSGNAATLSYLPGTCYTHAQVCVISVCNGEPGELGLRKVKQGEILFAHWTIAGWHLNYKGASGTICFRLLTDRTREVDTSGKLYGRANAIVQDVAGTTNVEIGQIVEVIFCDRLWLGAVAGCEGIADDYGLVGEVEVQSQCSSNGYGRWTSLNGEWVLVEHTCPAGCTPAAPTRDAPPINGVETLTPCTGSGDSQTATVARLIVKDCQTLAAWIRFATTDDRTVGAANEDVPCSILAVDNGQSSSGGGGIGNATYPPATWLTNRYQQISVRYDDLEFPHALEGATGKALLDVDYGTTIGTPNMRYHVVESDQLSPLHRVQHNEFCPSETVAITQRDPMFFFPFSQQAQTQSGRITDLIEAFDVFQLASRGGQGVAAWDESQAIWVMLQAELATIQVVTTDGDCYSVQPIQAYHCEDPTEASTTDVYYDFRLGFSCPDSSDPQASPGLHLYGTPIKALTCTIAAQETLIDTLPFSYRHVLTDVDVDGYCFVGMVGVIPVPDTCVEEDEEVELFCGAPCDDQSSS